ncbi:MAG: hypothetical protein FWG05_02185 [Kiritimatiellaeota bacterium]|nr:hypothetical protein [Kiritimatiellota bacterium]
MKPFSLIVILASLALSGCVTATTWEAIDSVKYKTVTRGSMLDEKFDRLIEKRNAALANSDVQIVLDDNEVMVRKRKISRFFLDTAKILTAPFTLAADMLILAATSSSNPDNWFGNSEKSSPKPRVKTGDDKVITNTRQTETPSIFKK